MNLPLPIAVAIWLVVGAALLWLVMTGRRRLARRTAPLVPAPPVIDDAVLGAVRLGPIEAVYVSSTLAGDWLARVGAHGLGDRSAATVTVHDGGVHLARQGAPDVVVPATALRHVGTSAGQAGKFVGGDGLVVLTWQVPSDGTVDAALLDTGLRTRYRADRQPLVEAASALVATETDDSAHTPSSPTAPAPEDQ